MVAFGELRPPQKMLPGAAKSDPPKGRVMERATSELAQRVTKPHEFALAPKVGWFRSYPRPIICPCNSGLRKESFTFLAGFLSLFRPRLQRQEIQLFSEKKNEEYRICIGKRFCGYILN